MCLYVDSHRTEGDLAAGPCVYVDPGRRSEVYIDGSLNVFSAEQDPLLEVGPVTDRTFNHIGLSRTAFGSPFLHNHNYASHLANLVMKQDKARVPCSC